MKLLNNVDIEYFEDEFGHELEIATIDTNSAELIKQVNRAISRSYTVIEKIEAMLAILDHEEDKALVESMIDSVQAINFRCEAEEHTLYSEVVNTELSLGLCA